MPDAPSLTSLVASASAGDAAAWGSIVDRFSSLLWGTARSFRLSQAEAEDVVQNTWLRLLDNLSGIQQPEALAGWLATTARYECLGLLRRRGRDHLVRDDDLAATVVDDNAVALDSALLTDERDAQLWSCFNQLPERCRRLLRILMAHDRPNYTEVAAALDMPVGSIGPTRGRCLGTLRGLVAESGYAFGSEGWSR